MKRNIKIILFSILMSHLCTPARAESNSFRDFDDLLLLEGTIALSAYAMAQNPEGVGTFFIVTSPLMAGLVRTSGEYEVAYYLLGVTFLAGYGNWLHEQEGEDESEIARDITLSYNAMLVTGWILKNTSSSSSFEHEQGKGGYSIQLNPETNDLFFTYSVRF